MRALELVPTLPREAPPSAPRGGAARRKRRPFLSSPAESGDRAVGVPPAGGSYSNVLLLLARGLFTTCHSLQCCAGRFNRSCFAKTARSPGNLWSRLSNSAVRCCVRARSRILLSKHPCQCPAFLGRSAVAAACTASRLSPATQRRRWWQRPSSGMRTTGSGVG